MTSPGTLLKALNIFPKKQLGQNFLSDPLVAKMITDRSNFTDADIVLEVGAGLGALTVPLAKRARKVYAVETDRRLIPLLKGELLLNKIENVVVLESDFFKVNIAELSDKEGEKLLVAGNLPYYISSQILIRLIDFRKSIRRAILTFQKEVAERIAMHPGNKAYGRLSVILQYYADIKTVTSIKASQFYPRPQVDSLAVEINFKEEIPHPVLDETAFSKVVKASFAKRRKTLKNALMESELRLDEGVMKRIFDETGIDPMRRAETLCVEEFVRLTNTYGTIVERNNTL